MEPGGFVKRLVVTQRVLREASGERRDALDQRWCRLLAEVGAVAWPLPNLTGDVAACLDGVGWSGAVLTGGNSLEAVGGDAPERDRVERELLAWCAARRLPVLGVCRGMQVLHDYFGGSVERVTGHVTPQLTIECDGQPRIVNSFHDFGFREPATAFRVWARAADGVVKAVRHIDLPWVGVMWHPERNWPIEVEDLKLLASLFGP